MYIKYAFLSNVKQNTNLYYWKVQTSLFVCNNKLECTHTHICIDTHSSARLNWPSRAKKQKHRSYHQLQSPTNLKPVLRYIFLLCVFCVCICCVCVHVLFRIIFVCVFGDLAASAALKLSSTVYTRSQCVSVSSSVCVCVCVLRIPFGCCFSRFPRLKLIA